jgi:hypothetical protein
MMVKRCKKLLCALFTLTVIVFAGLPANAMTYHFSQTGYTGGGVITGSFDAVDLNADGQIASFAGEVTAFSLNFSSDYIVGNFSHSMGDLYGLVYDIGSGFIGDGNAGYTEGLASNWLMSSVGYSYASGLGPNSSYGGIVTDLATGASSSTQNLIAVSSVPLPSALLLFGPALAGLGMLRRKFVK